MQFHFKVVFSRVMRIFSAWFLLLVATFQWAGGLFSFKIAEIVSAEIYMTSAERFVADLYELETGLSIQVKEISEDFDFKMIGYSNKFVLTEDVGGKPANFLIQTDSTETYVVETTIGLSNEQKEEGQIASILQCLLTEYIHMDSDELAPEWRLAALKNPVHNTSSNYNFAAYLDTPPPQRFS